ncbi:DUF899 domain-containing protein [Armatimonas rosea]|uniref:Putative dithiol-disulfide oxidoreductase (DUF899 family) n=1 Tax=Armatimonas rosea TaxID=685828 RepID=A0A7W9W688_ARMRO|nr:DUF899 domain-containing protein [Armatimonas rosea]MBB6051214.1 putative dithiol-disulfide oxidoreductase (DUF899 family) [Armatimonas rosea]
MSENQIPHPPIVSREQWAAEREALLLQEKAHTREGDRLAAARRRLPMVKLDKAYVFDGPEGKQQFLDLFAGKRQLIVYHFMYGPDWERGCPGCTGFVDAIADLSLLDERDTRFVLVSRAPLAKLDTWKQERGWSIPWYSSFESEFNYDFDVTREQGEASGLSVFFQLGDEVYHTYSTYARGVENLVHTYALLDVTPYGRQEDFEDSPEGWPQKPTYG